MPDLYSELKRRNVFRVAVAYVVLSWLLLQVGDVLFDTLELPSSWNKGLLAILALGLAPALIFSWIYELTPEGVKKESEIEASESITAHTARKLDVTVIALLVMAIGLFLWDRFDQEPAPQGTRSELAKPESAAPAPATAALSLATGVAVLPFDNLSSDAENAFFASGIHEDVLTYLSRVKDLRVISRTSVENYADSTLSLTQIGQELGVSHVLEGSVRRAADRVRVTVQLIDALTDEHVWAENYDRTLDDIFAIQTEIAQNIVDRLQVELSPEAIDAVNRLHTTNTKAYELYLRARDLARGDFTPEGYLHQESLLREALALDPEFVGGWQLLAQTCGWMVWFGADLDGAQRACADEAVQKVQQLAPGSAEAGAAVAHYRYQVEEDFRGTIEALEPVVDRLPGDVLVTKRLALAHYHLGHAETAAALIEKALLMDPADQSIHGVKALNLNYAGQWDQAVALFDDLVERFPDNSNIAGWRVAARWSHLGDVATALHWARTLEGGAFTQESAVRYIMSAGDLEGAVALLDRLGAGAGLAADPTRAQLRGWIDRLQGRSESADRAFAENVDRWREALSPVESAGALVIMAYTLALAGDDPAAMDYRQRALAALETDQDLILHPSFRNLLALALAETGDIEAAWDEIEPLIRAPGGLTEWDLLLDYDLRYYYSGLPAYQALVEGLEPIR